MVSRPEVLWRAQVRGEFIEIGGFGSAQGCSDLVACSVVFGPRQVGAYPFRLLEQLGFFSGWRPLDQMSERVGVS